MIELSDLAFFCWVVLFLERCDVGRFLTIKHMKLHEMREAGQNNLRQRLETSARVEGGRFDKTD